MAPCLIAVYVQPIAAWCYLDLQLLPRLLSLIHAVKVFFSHSPKLFDPLQKTPTTFAPDGVIPGWTEALQLMRAGDKYVLPVCELQRDKITVPACTIRLYDPLQFANVA